MADAERFWSKVERTDGCWLWRGIQRGRPGYPPYGGFTAMHPRRMWRAHRYAWTLTHGPIPDGLCVCHRCDNRLCVNPDHLWLGTHADNIRDRDAKGRHRVPLGVEVGTAKLTDDAVREIRVAEGTQRAVAARFGIDQSLVSRIRSRQVWAHVQHTP